MPLLMRVIGSTRRGCRHEHIARHDSGVAQREERRRKCRRRDVSLRTKRRAEAVAVSGLREHVAAESRDGRDCRGQRHCVVICSGEEPETILDGCSAKRSTIAAEAIAQRRSAVRSGHRQAKRAGKLTRRLDRELDLPTGDTAEFR